MADEELPPYPAGLRLAGRRVVVVGGGHVAQRRVPALLAVGAVVEVVSPVVTPSIEGLVGSGEVTWHERGFEPTDLDGAWYVIAATDVREVNEEVSRAAEERRIFCGNAIGRATYTRNRQRFASTRAERDAEDRAGARELALVVDDLGDPEVEHLHGALGRHEHVRGLEVAVHDALRVRVGQGPRHLRRGGAPVQADHHPRGDQCRRGGTDALLLGGVLRGLVAQRQVVGDAVGDRTAPGTGDHLLLGELVEELGADEVHLAEVRPVGVLAAVVPVADRRTAVCVTLDAETGEEPHLERRRLGEVVHGARVDRRHVAPSDGDDLVRAGHVHGTRVAFSRDTCGRWGCAGV